MTSLCLSPRLAQLARDNFFHCGVFYEDSLSSQAHTRMELEEDVKIYLEDNYERINVPVPQFGGGDPADIIHDFQRVRPARGRGGAGAWGGRGEGGRDPRGGPSHLRQEKDQVRRENAVPCTSRTTHSYVNGRGLV